MIKGKMQSFINIRINNNLYEVCNNWVVCNNVQQTVPVLPAWLYSYKVASIHNQNALKSDRLLVPYFFHLEDHAESNSKFYDDQTFL